MAKLQLVQEPAADALREANPFALLVGMMLDQQIPMEVAFAGPKKIADRIGDVPGLIRPGTELVIPTGLTSTGPSQPS